MYMVLLQKPKFSDGQVLTMYSNEGNVWVSPPGFYGSQLGPDSKIFESNRRLMSKHLGHYWMESKIL